MIRHSSITISAFAAILGASQLSAATFTDFSDFQAAATILMMEDFDSAPWPTGFPIFVDGLNGTENRGVRWTAANDFSLTAFVPARSGAASAFDLGFDKLITAELPSGTTAVGGFVAVLDSPVAAPAVTLTAFDASDNSLGAVTVIEPLTFSFLGVTSAIPIAKVEFSVPDSTVTPADEFRLDDFYFGQVPEPTSSMALASLGISGLSCRRRRRNR